MQSKPAELRHVVASFKPANPCAPNELQPFFKTSRNGHVTPCIMCAVTLKVSAHVGMVSLPTKL